MKQCHKCKTDKPLSSFKSQIKKLSNGEVNKYRANVCNDCNRGQYRKHKKQSQSERKRDRVRDGFFNVTQVDNWVC